MTLRVLATILVLLGTGLLWAADVPAQDAGPSPGSEEAMAAVTAAEGEAGVGEARDFLVDMLWTNTEEHWHNGRWEEAIRLCRQIVEIDPHFVEAYTGAAWMLWSMDEDEAAIELYRAGVTANPDRYEVYHDFGMYYFHEKDYDKAVEQFRGSVENDAPAYYQHMLPNCLERGGHAEEALEEWRALLKRFPEDPIAPRHIKALEEQLAE
ncbi:MAG TPA: tetratricopeptide repeat protein [Armatimonadota bacterium]|nr:tetratricopeptide repeat protein [Armatimonadota bacterium]